MKDQLDKIEAKVDKISERIHSIDITLAVNTDQLATHIKRTDIAEKRLEHVEKHVHSVQTVIKISAGLVTFLGIVLGFLKFFYH